ncbi:MAG: 4-(cytidine 5'-diphospho)-2-C-methyl-D-erythritol kinase [Kiritimatiellae bacterium]|nr:4-(cytidine 5'-diphospho)-2-C-methyl-D-erythritol kinase [Kiritimatiellia bacterium]
MIIEAFAKVNFTLEVFGRRPDGFHDLRSVVVPVSLSDTLELELAEDIVSNSGFVDDLCVKAAEALREACQCRLGAAIKVEKRIPVGGGLGGGSADAAAVLVALNSLWGLGKSREELARIAAAVGSDVPALTLGGAVVMEGRGEKVRALELPSGMRFHLVLVNPGVFCSTGEVYARCNKRLQKDAAILYNMVSAMETGSCSAAGSAMMNDLQESAISLHPEIATAMTALEEAGAGAVLMSGSGSTVFALVPSEARGREIAALMEAKGYWARSVHTVVR